MIEYASIHPSALPGEEAIDGDSSRTYRANVFMIKGNKKLLKNRLQQAELLFTSAGVENTSCPARNI